MSKKIAIAASLIIVATTVVLVARAQQPTSLDNNIIEANKPYVPTRLQWLAMCTNTVIAMANPDYIMVVIPIKDKGELSIYVRYSPSTDREIMNSSIDKIRSSLQASLKDYGWDNWIKISEDVKMEPKDSKR